MQKIPKATVHRLSVYHRRLQGILSSGQKVVSSADLARMTNVNPAQLRKDLSYFGKFGVRGVGYQVEWLIRRLQEILGIGREWRIAIVGVECIGEALLQHKPFENNGYNFVAAFDFDAGKKGKAIGKGLIVKPFEAIGEAVQELGIQLGVIAVPNEKAQQVADAFVAAGVKGLMNFSTTRVDVPEGITLKDVDFTMLMDTITYAVSKKAEQASQRKKLVRRDSEEGSFYGLADMSAMAVA